METKLNFGCGKDIKSKSEGWINVDIQEAEGIDKSFNFNEFPYPFPDHTFDYIFSDNVLEHLKYPMRVIQEFYRICKKDGIIEIIVPYFPSKWAWGDLTHINFFNEKTIHQLFFGKDYNYNKNNNFEILSFRKKPSIPFIYFPEFINKVFNRYLNNIYSEIKIKVEVKK